MTTTQKRVTKQPYPRTYHLWSESISPMGRCLSSTNSMLVGPLRTILVSKRRGLAWKNLHHHFDDFGTFWLSVPFTYFCLRHGTFLRHFNRKWGARLKFRSWSSVWRVPGTQISVTWRHLLLCCLCPVSNMSRQCCPMWCQGSLTGIKLCK